jgi:hypothetical protein
MNSRTTSKHWTLKRMWAWLVIGPGIVLLLFLILPVYVIITESHATRIIAGHPDDAPRNGAIIMSMIGIFLYVVYFLGLSLVFFIVGRVRERRTP